MKKEYIKPEMADEILLMESLMGPSLSGGEADENEPAGGNSRRGRWGNLWDEE